MVKEIIINSPFPASNLQAECDKAVLILAHIIKNKNDVDSKLIPKKLLLQAKGIAVISILKAGFGWSGKIGAGIVIARLPDGSWSGPSAIATGGVGFGLQIGASLTDCLFLLNTNDAVKAFSKGGNVTFGGNLSVAAGPVGRSAEASGTILALAPVYSYSKSKGLFAGISFEGAVLIARNDANRNWYNQKISPEDILTGKVARPTQGEALYRVLREKFENSANTLEIVDNAAANFGMDGSAASKVSGAPKNQLPSYSPLLSKAPLPPPRTDRLSSQKVIALYKFEGERSSDLSFEKGDLIEVVKRSNNPNDWWKGKIGNREGDFPANYVESI